LVDFLLFAFKPFGFILERYLLTFPKTQVKQDLPNGINAEMAAKDYLSQMNNVSE
jgi:hypothetical protein